MKCGNANSKGNIQLTYRGGCRKELKIENAYRCVGCGGWFHKDCLIEHFKQEEKHDWGRQKEKEKNEQILAEIIDDLYLKYKKNFVDYKNKTHKLGWFKEDIKAEFNRRTNE